MDCAWTLAFGLGGSRGFSCGLVRFGFGLDGSGLGWSLVGLGSLAKKTMNSAGFIFRKFQLGFS